ncbi:VOC family protein, partial [Micromonospora chalcea]|nr:VOC family protein [Micromonospora chalcea]
MMKKITPIFRIFDEDKAKEFYVDFLEFRMDWEHRYEDDLPLYMQVSSGDCEIHLSGHHGDCTPGSAIRVEVEDIQSLHAKLIAKKYK